MFDQKIFAKNIVAVVVSLPVTAQLSRSFLVSSVAYRFTSILF